MYDDIQAEYERLRALPYRDLIREQKRLHVGCTKRFKGAIVLAMLDGQFGPSAVNKWMGDRIAGRRS